MKLRKLRSRPGILALLCVIITLVLVARLYDLQILRGEGYKESFAQSVSRTVSIPSKRGRILDRNGKVIADTLVTQNVTIVDNTGNTSEENDRLNYIIKKTLQILDQNGEDPVQDFGISFDGSEFVYEKEDSELLRFLADVYGYPLTDTLSQQEKEASAADIVCLLADRYRIPEEMDTPDARRLLLNMVAARYRLALKAYQKYVPTILAQRVGKGTIEAIIAETDLDGVNIVNDYERVYTDSLYLSAVTGYTSLISEEALEQNPDQYDPGDYVGKVGIEASMEEVLRGKNGYREISVDSLGREQAELSYVKPTQGNDVYLTIDSDLQKNTYKILEKNMREIILSKLTDRVTSFAITQDTDGSDILIPAADVYASLLSYQIERDHFYSEDASESETELRDILGSYHEKVREEIRAELESKRTVYSALTREYQEYCSYISRALFDRGALDSSLADEGDEIYKAWTGGSSSSLGEFLSHAAQEGWIDTEVIGTDASDPDEIFKALTEYVLDEPCEDYSFGNIECRYMMESGAASGELVCSVLFDQKLFSPTEKEREDIEKRKSGSAYSFVRRIIENGSLTPGDLYLYPFCGSVVVTDPADGTVLALVSYPGYDCNLLQDSAYMDRIKWNPAKPMLNHATQQRTAPGSTFKMVTAAAGIGEGVITASDTVSCYDVFDKIEPSPACWIYPSGHGRQNLQNAITNSCNNYFYEVGYRLGETGGSFDNEAGISVLSKYASMFGFDRKSGVEIEEAEPSVATRDVVRAAIGQSNNGFTAAALARYVSAVAMKGEIYDLTLLDHSCDGDGNILEKYDAKPLDPVKLDDSYWESVREGMRKVCTSRYGFSSVKRNSQDKAAGGVSASGKTGTAQQGVNTPNHAIFLGYAPSDDPEIAIAVRIPNGYSSSYAAHVAAQVMQYYFAPESLPEILNSTYIPDNENGD